jgi:hypothetical protein
MSWDGGAATVACMAYMNMWLGPRLCNGNCHRGWASFYLYGCHIRASLCRLWVLNLMRPMP